jgi:hypothetical protein
MFDRAFNSIFESYQVLSDDKRRAQYDSQPGADPASVAPLDGGALAVQVARNVPLKERSAPVLNHVQDMSYAEKARYPFPERLLLDMLTEESPYSPAEIGAIFEGIMAAKAKDSRQAPELALEFYKLVLNNYIYPYIPSWRFNLLKAGRSLIAILESQGDNQTSRDILFEMSVFTRALRRGAAAAALAYDAQQALARVEAAHPELRPPFSGLKGKVLYCQAFLSDYPKHSVRLK